MQCCTLDVARPRSWNCEPPAGETANLLAEMHANTSILSKRKKCSPLAVHVRYNDLSGLELKRG